VFQVEKGHLLRVGGAETLQSPLQSPLRLATKAIPRRPPEDSQGEVSCPSFKPPPPPPLHPPPLGELRPDILLATPLPPPPPPCALPPARAEGRWRTARGRRCSRSRRGGTC
jgi:hypothetical protein